MNISPLRLFSLSCCLIWGLSLHGQSLFHRLYTGEPSIEVAIAPASNGEVFFVFDSYNDTAAFLHRLVMLRLDADGTLLQEQGLFNPPSFRMGQIYGTSDNGLLIMGTEADPLSDEDSVFVVKLDANADQAWAKAFQVGPDPHEVRGVLETNDGGFIVYGIFEDFNTFSATIFLVKIDVAGDLVWSRTINSQLAGAFLKLGGMVETANGDLWLSGSTRFNTEGSWLTKLNASGMLQSTTYYNTHKLTDSQPEPFALFARSNGEMDIFYNSTSFQDGSVLLNLRTNANGVPIQTRRYYLPHTNGGEVTSCRPNGTGGYLMAGYHFPNSFRSSGIAFEIDANDNFLWAGSYGTSYIELLTGIVPTSDGGNMLGGFADPDSVILSPSENGLFPWLVKTDGMGVSNCFSLPLGFTTADTITTSQPYQLAEASGPGLADFSMSPFPISVNADTVMCQPLGIEVLPDQSMRAFPNPTSGRLTLELRQSYPGATLTLTDALGRELHREELPNQTQFYLDIAGPEGLYFLSLTTTTGKRRTHKILKN